VVDDLRVGQVRRRPAGPCSVVDLVVVLTLGVVVHSQGSAGPLDR
jgi:hypothetical protein